MKNTVVAGVVGAVILFAYQSLSWMVLPFHDNALKYNANQDSILAALSANLTEDGVYHVPNTPPGTSQADQEKAWQAWEGKPSAKVLYTSKTTMSMGSDMAVGFILNLLAAGLVAMLLSKFSGVLKTFGNRFMAVFSFPLFLLLEGTLMEWNWWHTPGHYLSGYIIDIVVMGVLLGSWMAWYFGRQPQQS